MGHLSRIVEDKEHEHRRAHGHTFPCAMDHDNRVSNQYGVFGLVVSVFVDEASVAQAHVRGGLLTGQKIHEVVKRIRPQSQRVSGFTGYIRLEWLF